MSNGFDDLIKGLEKQQKKVQDLSERKEVPILEILNDQFMQNHTDFQSFEEFLTTGNFDFNNFESIEDHEIDPFVADHPKFNSWNDLWNHAQQVWFSDQLGF